MGQPLKIVPNFDTSTSTADRQTAWQDNMSHLGVIVDIDISAFTGTGVVFTIQGKDPGSNSTYDILASASQTGTGHLRLVVDPRVAAVSNTHASHPLPRQWRVDVNTNTVSNIAYTMSYTRVG